MKDFLNDFSICGQMKSGPYKGQHFDLPGAYADVFNDSWRAVILRDENGHVAHRDVRVEDMDLY